MRLYEFLTDETILPALQVETKEAAIAEVAETLRGHASVRDFDEFLGAVFAREMDSTTGVGHGVAIPHARTDSVDDFVAAVGRVPDGVDFQAVDGQNVRLIILMGIPTRKVKSYLKLLAHLSLLIKQGDFTEAVAEAPDPAAVRSVFEAFEQ
ncbi:MAG: PTS sugar transporter subunit IIA [Phycisphaerae bacterium]|nr:PTS sugar transporter subunit IIA [Phycisphaerae bacterium]